MSSPDGTHAIRRSGADRTGRTQAERVNKLIRYLKQTREEGLTYERLRKGPKVEWVLC